MPTIDRSHTTDVLTRLVRTDSVNPALVPGAAGESAIASVTESILRDLDMQVDRHDVAPGRPNVVGRIAGTGGGRSLMLNAHYDTVGVDGMTDPFSAEVRDGRLYGRGAYDMKGALAACIGATHALRAAGIRLAGDLVIAAVADEEHASLGTRALLARDPVDGAIVTEPTANRLCVAHKGFVWATFTTRGRAAHGSRPDLGIDANLRMGRILARLSDLATALDDGPRHPLLGPGSIHAATLHGGTGLSTYAADCRLGVERRTIPGESGARVMADLAALLDTLRAEDPAFDGSLEHLLTREPFEARPDSAIAACVERAAGQVLGRAPDRVGETPWMDAALLSSVGIDTVVFGPHGEGAHAAVEWVELESVFQCAEVLAHTAIEYCGISED